MSDLTRIYDADGFRRIGPSERSPGLVELQLPNGRCFAAVGFGPAVEQAVTERARATSPRRRIRKDHPHV